MISLRHAFSIERRRQAKVDMHGDGRVFATIAPAQAGREYITFVLGDLPLGARVTMEDLADALQHHTDAIRAALDGSGEAATC